MTEFDLYVKKIEESLHASVVKALERKEKLGEYAVIWQDEKVVRILEQPPVSLNNNDKN